MLPICSYTDFFLVLILTAIHRKSRRNSLLILQKRKLRHQEIKLPKTCPEIVRHRLEIQSSFNIYSRASFNRILPIVRFCLFSNI